MAYENKIREKNRNKKGKYSRQEYKVSIISNN